MRVHITKFRKTKRKPKPFAIHHNPKSHNILRAANQFSPVLEQLNNTKLSDFINRRWQAPNLKMLLTTSKFTSSWERVCKPAMWNMCLFGKWREKTLKSDNRLNPNASIDCKTQNVIYCLNVKLCQLWWQWFFFSFYTMWKQTEINDYLVKVFYPKFKKYRILKSLKIIICALFQN